MSLLAVTLAAGPAAAQLDLSGAWGPIYHEDFDERIPGPALVDFLGIPINDAALQWALSWDSSRLALPEHQCQVHTSAYIYRGPMLMRIWDQKHPETQELIAIRMYISTYEQNRTVWMDGRPHPPDYEKHTWQGFSTGRWEGDVLVVTTSHIKQGWHRRNGVPSSDRIRLTEYFSRHGDHLTHVSVVEDPDYLAEPLVKSQDFQFQARPANNWLWPCEYVDETPERARHDVPHYLPGENPYLDEFAKQKKIPLEAALGGPETMYPEFQSRLRGRAPAR